MQNGEQEVYERERKRLARVLAEADSQLHEVKGMLSGREEGVIRVRKDLMGVLNKGGPDSRIEASQIIQSLSQTMSESRGYLRDSRRLQRMVESPYFGRIDFYREGNDEREQMYIGLGTLIESDSDAILVYDWRAPVSSMFYDYGPGPAAYRTASKTFRGTIELKRQYRIEDRELKFLFDTSLNIDDAMLQEILARSRDGRMQHIVYSIQRRQNEAIRDDQHRLLIVQGAAGSGKTSIALHRAAYLLYRYRGELDSENMIILSPNQIFSDYISDVLPHLGEENMTRLPFHALASLLVVDEEGVVSIEGEDEFFEYLLSSKREEDPGRRDSIRFKCSSEFAQVMKRYVEHLEEEGLECRDIRCFGETVITADRMRELFTERYAYLPYLNRLGKIRRRLLFLLRQSRERELRRIQNQVEGDPDLRFVSRGEKTRYCMGILREELRPLRRWLQAHLHRSVLGLYRQLFADDAVWMGLAGDGPLARADTIREWTCRTLKEGRILWEDTIPLVYMKQRLLAGCTNREIREVVVDEAQDYSCFHFMVLRELFPEARMTVLGDLNQNIRNPAGLEDYTPITGLFKDEEQKRITLTTSYRSTREIIAFSRALLVNGEPVSAVDRRGPRPKVVLPGQGCSNFPGRITDSVARMKENGARSVAVICRREGDALRLAEELGQESGATLLRGQSQSFVRGTVILPSYMSKGLEFDGVLVVIDGQDDYHHQNERGLLYMVCTRALHWLEVHSRDGRPSFLPDRDLFELVTADRFQAGEE